MLLCCISSSFLRSAVRCLCRCIPCTHCDPWGFSQPDAAHTPSHSPYCFWGFDVFACLPTFVRACVCVCVCVCSRARARVRLCVYLCMCQCVRVFVCARAFLGLCMFVCLRMRACVGGPAVVAWPHYLCDPDFPQVINKYYQNRLLLLPPPLPLPECSIWWFCLLNCM